MPRWHEKDRPAAISAYLCAVLHGFTAVVTFSFAFTWSLWFLPLSVTFFWGTWQLIQEGRQRW